ncbi:MAG: hypothetical protein M1483_01880 [Actinobacteria bacterium]|nr:hypothetical protein [Actinomycetota bacterium]
MDSTLVAIVPLILGYYASCPAGTYVSSVSGWGATYNTVQFKGSGVDCGP